MARNYKRDARGRFAKVASRRAAKKRIRSEYKHGKKFNRSIAAYAVQSGQMTEAQAGARLRQVQRLEKQRYKADIKGLKVKK